VLGGNDPSYHSEVAHRIFDDCPLAGWTGVHARPGGNTIRRNPWLKAVQFLDMSDPASLHGTAILLSDVILNLPISSHNGYPLFESVVNYGATKRRMTAFPSRWLVINRSDTKIAAMNEAWRGLREQPLSSAECACTHSPRPPGVGSVMLKPPGTVLPLK